MARSTTGPASYLQQSEPGKTPPRPNAPPTPQTPPCPPDGLASTCQPQRRGTARGATHINSHTRRLLLPCRRWGCGICRISPLSHPLPPPVPSWSAICQQWFLGRLTLPPNFQITLSNERTRQRAEFVFQGFRCTPVLSQFFLCLYTPGGNVAHCRRQSTGILLI